MLGNSSGGKGLVDAGRTAVAIRSLTTQGPTTRKSAKKKQVDGSGVDRVVREDENALVELIGDEDRESASQEIVEPGHATGSRHVEGRAFRLNSKGRQIPPTYGDVDQGNLGDGWLMASCAAVAHAQPAHLLKRVSRNKPGEFTVTLGDEMIQVNSEFSNAAYADPTPNGQCDTLWVALVEKAYARREALSYGNLECGNPGRALDALTGHRSRRTSITTTSSLDTLEKRLVDGKKGGRAMVLSTNERGVSVPLHVDHTYAVLDVFTKKDECLVKVYNPWGTKSNSRTLESMTHQIPLSEIRQSCGALYVSGG